LEREQLMTASAQDVLVLAVPAYRGRLAPLPAERRAAFARHLRSIIDAAFEERARLSQTMPAPPVSSALRKTAEAACAACAGQCCSKGGDHAYLDDDTIRRLAQGRPELTRRRIAALYLSHLGEETFAGSCVFHAAAGCRLPRTLRADLCNVFYCNPLRRFLREHADTPPQVRIEARAGAV
jgi:hypothetical protein